MASQWAAWATAFVAALIYRFEINLVTKLAATIAAILVAVGVTSTIFLPAKSRSRNLLGHLAVMGVYSLLALGFVVFAGTLW